MRRVEHGDGRPRATRLSDLVRARWRLRLLPREARCQGARGCARSRMGRAHAGRAHLDLRRRGDVRALRDTRPHAARLTRAEAREG